MAAINFPDSPTTGDTYTVLNKTWVFNGSAWISSLGTIGVLSDISAEAPITYNAVSGVIGLDEESLLIDGGTA